MRLRRLLARSLRGAGDRVLRALPARWLPRLAWAWARVRLVGPDVRRAAADHLAFALGRREPEVTRALLVEAFGVHVHARLLARRSDAVARCRDELRDAPWSRDRPRPLLLLAACGATALARAAAACARFHAADLDALPTGAEDAAWLAWLGRVTAVDLAPLRRALGEGRGVRLLLVLPGEGGWRTWWSPDLAAPGGAVATAERALDALAVLVRAAPHLWDWSLPRWRLRPEREVEGHSPSSRLAPWLNPRRRAGPRGRRGR